MLTSIFSVIGGIYSIVIGVRLYERLYILKKYNLTQSEYLLYSATKLILIEQDGAEITPQIVMQKFQENLDNLYSFKV